MRLKVAIILHEGATGEEGTVTMEVTQVIGHRPDDVDGGDEDGQVDAYLPVREKLLVHFKVRCRVGLFKRFLRIQLQCLFYRDTTRFLK